MLSTVFISSPCCTLIVCSPSLLCTHQALSGIPPRLRPPPPLPRWWSAMEKGERRLLFNLVDPQPLVLLEEARWRQLSAAAGAGGARCWCKAEFRVQGPAQSPARSRSQPPALGNGARLFSSSSPLAGRPPA